VIDGENDQVQVHRINVEEPEFSFPTGMNPKGIALSKSRTIWISHQFIPGDLTNSTYRGTELLHISRTSLTHPIQLGYREEGDLREYSLKGELIREINTQLSPLNTQRFISNLLQTRGMACDPTTGNLYLTVWSHRQIQQLDSEGHLIKTINPNGDKNVMAGPSEIALLSSNLLVVSDTCSSFVKILSINTGEVITPVVRQSDWMSHQV